VFPFHETELSIPRLIHEHTYEFGKFDVSKVKGFCPIPQQGGAAALKARLPVAST
jgi:hypothetical protein